MNSVPNIMISSTFYDLRQVRKDLSEFLISELGYRPLLSEHNSFPIDPDMSTVDNCRRRVEEEADVLVLVVGGRYGSVDLDSDTSVTNLEYLTARAKGIPTYAFVEKRVLAVLSSWQDNRDADFTSVVDTSRVFEFIDQIRNKDKVWTHEFESAQDITATLRGQFAYLMSHGLQLRAKFTTRVFESPLLRGLSGEALRLILERPNSWEYRLYTRVLVDEFDARKALKREYELGLTFGPAESVNMTSFGPLLRARIAELETLSGNAETLLNEVTQDAFGKPGEAGDAEKIVFVARQIARVYEDAIDWSLRMKRVVAESPFDRAIDPMSKFASKVIISLEESVRELDARVTEALTTGKPTKININIVLEAAEIDRFHEAMASIQRELGLES